MNHLINRINQITEVIGRALAWLTLALVLVTCTLVLVRYFLQWGNLIILQELAIYFHAAVFMLGSSWALKHDRHVRVDVLYNRRSKNYQAWIDALGVLVFLMPFAIFVLFASEDYVFRSWQIRESSPEPGGIPALFVLKSFIPLMAVLLLLQGLAELLRCLTQLLDKPDRCDAD